MTSHCRAALEAAGLPVDPRASEHFRRFWHIESKTQKWCQRCHELKDLDAFDVGSGQLGRHSYCKPCRADYNRKAAA